MPRTKKANKAPKKAKISKVLASPSLSPPPDIPLVIQQPKSVVAQKQPKFWSKLNWRKITISTIITVIILNIFALLYVNVVWARPGDLFFFPRQLLESVYLRSNQNSAVAQLAILDNRLLSFIELQNRHNCVQLVVAENELANKLREIDKLIGFSSSEPQKVYFTWLSNIPEYLTSDTTCQLDLKVREMKVLGREALREMGDVETFADHQAISQKTLAQKYDELISLSQKASFHSQADLDNFNDMMLRYNSLVTDNSPVSIYSQEKAIQNAEHVIYVEDEFEDHQDLVNGICFFLPPQKCNPQILSSQWNSISQRTTFKQKFDASLNLANQYLKLLIPNQD